jgi:hypothetical protein
VVAPLLESQRHTGGGIEKKSGTKALVHNFCPIGTQLKAQIKRQND